MTKQPLTIISASRRTDIPAFYMPWFLNRLRAGSVSYPNPFSGQVCTVSLQPEHVHSIVFWSKSYAPFLPHIDTIEERGYHFICHYTITGAPRRLEPHVPDWLQSALTLRKLAERIGPRRVLWRFDPILFTGDLDATHYLERFKRIIRTISGATERCYFSFAAFYGKVRRRLEQQGIRAIDPPLDEKRALAEQMVAIAAEHGITLYACCQDMLVDEQGQKTRVHKAHCIDGDLLAELFPDRPQITQHRPTRETCGCVASRDIGMYDSCAYGCAYCYANQRHATALAHRRAHNPQSAMLRSVPETH